MCIFEDIRGRWNRHDTIPIWSMETEDGEIRADITGQTRSEDEAGMELGYTEEQCKKDTMDHINQVREFMMIVVNGLTQRALVHDQSKLKSPELEIFVEYTPKLKNSTYGSEEYKGFLQGMGEALKHHYAHNSHHPEHFKKHVCIICFKEYKQEPPNRCETCMNGTFTEESDIQQMNLLDIVEMFCDWKAATMRHADGDIYKSIDFNKTRFRYSDDLAAIFRNTAKLFE